MPTDEEIIFNYESGLSINHICQKFNLTYTYVRYRIFKSGKTRKRHYIEDPEIDQRFNMLIYKETIKKRGQKKKWRMLCDCGNYKEIEPWLVVNNGVQCCGCATSKLLSDVQFKGYKDISLTYFNQIKNNAIKRNIEFSVSIEYIWDLYIKQNKKCALTGLELSLKDRSANKDKNASLDRIDPFEGYTEGNVQWVHQVVNSCKFMLNNEQFFTMCKLVVEENNNKIREDISFKNIRYANRDLGKHRYKSRS